MEKITILLIVSILWIKSFAQLVTIDPKTLPQISSMTIATLLGGNRLGSCG